MKHLLKIIGVLITGSLAQEEPDQEPMTGEYLFAKVTVQIIGEDEKPIPDVDVNIRFKYGDRYKDGYNDFHGKSDKNGLYGGESKTSGGDVIIIANKSGYYESEFWYNHPYELNRNFKPGDKLKPWNPTVPVMLKKIGKPIPMIVRRSSAPWIRQTTELEAEIGFDMIEYDWITPHGKGKVEDFKIRFSPNFSDEDKTRGTAKIRFVSPDNGLIPITELIGEESVLKFSRIAPEEGYEKKEIDLAGAPWGQYQDKQPKGYIFRIRTKKDPETGKIISAQYGKIIRRLGETTNVNPIKASMYITKKEGVPRASLIYSSYINPTPNDRNLEYDQKTNLAPEWEGGDFIAAP